MPTLSLPLLDAPSYRPPDTMGVLARSVYTLRYAHTLAGGQPETWAQVARRVAVNVLGAVRAPDAVVNALARDIADRVLMPGGRYLAVAGLPRHQVQNCLLLRAEDTREGWGRLADEAARALMTGAGVGVEYSDLRAEGSALASSRGTASGPLPAMHIVNEIGRAAKSGGDRRGAIWAGLRWSHPDVPAFLAAKQWAPEIVAMKARDFTAPAPFDHTNMSIVLDRDFFDAYADAAHPLHDRARWVFWEALALAVRTGEPGFSVDYVNARESLRNACTEITSEDSADVCNLASVNLARIVDLDHFRAVLQRATLFLLAGTVYSDVPFPRVAEVRARNRRLGLGLMGIHEWLLARGHRYECVPELHAYLAAYREVTGYAAEYADALGLATPRGTRAIAPTGTIGIVAETTTGIEPIFAAAYLRRYLDGGRMIERVVVDETARRLLAQGVPADAIEDSYSLARDPARRYGFQAEVQAYVDHAIASTVNLPAWGSAYNNADTLQAFGDQLLAVLPRLRGITFYPDGARSGQPLTSVPLAEALEAEGRAAVAYSMPVAEDPAPLPLDACSIRGGESCGS